MKRILSLILVVVMMFGCVALASCGPNGDTNLHKLQYYMEGQREYKNYLFDENMVVPESWKNGTAEYFKTVENFDSLYADILGSVNYTDLSFEIDRTIWDADNEFKTEIGSTSGYWDSETDVITFTLEYDFYGMPEEDRYGGQINWCHLVNTEDFKVSFDMSKYYDDNKFDVADASEEYLTVATDSVAGNYEEASAKYLEENAATWRAEMIEVIVETINLCFDKWHELTSAEGYPIKVVAE